MKGLKVISEVADCNCVDSEMCLLLTVFVVVVFSLFRYFFFFRFFLSSDLTAFGVDFAVYGAVVWLLCLVVAVDLLCQDCVPCFHLWLILVTCFQAA